MITLFEDFENSPMIKPDVNSVSNEFWKMVEIANWNAVIKGYSDNPIINAQHRDFYKDAQLRIYSKYSLEEIKKFHDEYDIIYEQLYDYFHKNFLKGKLNVHEDGYSDLLSSLIGKGKKFTNTCIEHPKFFNQMGMDDDYAENFVYLLNVGEKEYFNIKNVYPLERDTKKYNL